MRERRWISRSTLSFDEIVRLGDRLKDLGHRTPSAGQELIIYIEDWTVAAPGEIRRLARWPLEDVTFIRTHEPWSGDFFLLVGAYHTVYQRYGGSGTYCSISHPWTIDVPLQKHDPRAMLWVGFRNLSNSFVRVRLETGSVVAPGETREDRDRELWLSERASTFRTAVDRLDLSVSVDLDARRVMPRSNDPQRPLLCSWPDAFGPCQLESNSPDPFEYLVPAARLAETYGGRPATVRAYLNGFEEGALSDFDRATPPARYAYRISAHGVLEDLPQILETVLPDGRVYAGLCEFQAAEGDAGGPAPWVVIGAVGDRTGFRVESRLNRAPLAEDRMAGWLESLLAQPVEYAPLPAFP